MLDRVWENLVIHGQQCTRCQVAKRTRRIRLDRNYRQRRHAWKHLAYRVIRRAVRRKAPSDVGACHEEDVGVRNGFHEVLWTTVRVSAETITLWLKKISAFICNVYMSFDISQSFSLKARSHWRKMLKTSRFRTVILFKAETMFKVNFCKKFKSYSGADPGGDDWGGAISPPHKTYESNFFHHGFVRFGKKLDCQLKRDC